MLSVPFAGSAAAVEAPLTGRLILATRWVANNPTAGDAALSDVLVSRADGHVLAVGPAVTRAVIWDWNGTAWSERPIAGLDAGVESAVTNVDGDGQGHQWAFGSSGGRPLVLQRCTA